MTISRLRQRFRLPALAAAILAMGALALRPAAAQDARRCYLVTNDDGADSSGLAALVETLSAHADVVVVTPADDQSYAGSGKTLPSGMLRTRPLRMAGASAAYAIEGTPVDAVVFGISALGGDRPFDAVVAGINQGSALGSEATSIGVVGAALEAAAHGLPAIAVTQDRRAHVFDVSANLTAALLERWLGQGLADGIALSINVPASAVDRPRGVVVARLGQPELVLGGFHQVESPDAPGLWRIQWNKVRRPEKETDLDWYQRGEITVTPLRRDATATDLLTTLADWKIEAPARVPTKAP